MSAGRETILARVRAAVTRAAPHPGPPAVAQAPSSFQDLAAVLPTVGGVAHGPVPERDVARAVADVIAGWAPEPGARLVATPSAHAAVASVGAERLEPGTDPHTLSDVAVGIAWGAVGVAESAAIAVPGDDPGERALLFLAERLVLLLPADRIVPDLHAGLAALPPEDRARPGLVWISGPSKTADIEQALVFGAQGPRALAVVGVEREGL